MYYVCKPRKVSIYVNTGRKAMAQIQKELGCDIIINGGLFDGAFKPCCWLKVDGTILHSESWHRMGYGWEKNALIYDSSANIAKHSNYIQCVELPYNLSEKPSYPADMGGVRGRSAIGLREDGSTVIWCTSDGAYALTPEQLQKEMRDLGCVSSVMLDGGGSSQCITPNGKVVSSRVVHNFICIWLGEENEVSNPQKEEKTLDRPYQGIDTAAKITAKTAEILKREGYSFVARYLVPNSGGTAWKALTASEAKIIRDAGLAVMLCWETTAARVKGGAVYGEEDALAARRLAEDMGIPAGAVIYFAADYNVPEADYGAVNAYLSAASEHIGKYNVGLYGHEGIVNAMYGKGHKNFWQCVAWSEMFSDAAGVIQYEWQGGANAKALATKIGVAVDLNSAASLDGMWKPNSYADGGDIIYEHSQAQTKNTEAEDAHKWCVSMGITDDSMRDVSQTELMFWRYFKLTAPEDAWSIGTK